MNVYYTSARSKARHHDWKLAWKFSAKNDLPRVGIDFYIKINSVVYKEVTPELEQLFIWDKLSND